MPPRSPASRASASIAERLRVGLVELERRAARAAAPASRRAPDRSARRRSARACPGSRGARAPRRRGSGRARGRSTSGGRRPRSGRTATPKRKCASISSRPLFASVAESIVIFGPMFQVGCASASSGVTSASSSRVRPRNGPPLAVSTRLSGSPSLRALEERRVLAVDREQRASAPLLRARARASPAATRLSLFASASVDAALERPHRRREPGEADDRVQDEVGLGALEQLGEVAADLRERREPVDRLRARTRPRRARGRGARRSPRCAWRPIEPVAPSRAIRFIAGRVPDRLSRREPRSTAKREDARSTRPARRRAARRCGRACRRGRRAGVPVSFTCMSRLSIDSKRSPSGAATASTAPSTSDSAIERKSWS